MNKVDELLKARGLTFEDLKEEEKQNYFQWLGLLESKALTIADTQKYIEKEKNRLTLQIVETDEYVDAFFGLWRRPNRQHLLLKAQLKNLIYLEYFLSSVERKKAFIEAQIEKLMNK